MITRKFSTPLSRPLLLWAVVLMLALLSFRVQLLEERMQQGHPLQAAQTAQTAQAAQTAQTAQTKLAHPTMAQTGASHSDLPSRPTQTASAR